MQLSENISLNIYKQIVLVALREEAILKELNKGIFFMPELAFTYEVGKAIILNQEKIFGNKDWEFNREIKINSNGPTDLIITNKKTEEKVLFEFKIRRTIDDYLRDIKKLKSYSTEKCIKYFCALIDAYYDKNIKDERIEKLNKLVGKDISWTPNSFEFFTTPNIYEKQNVCIVSFWQIK